MADKNVMDWYLASNNLQTNLRTDMNFKSITTTTVKTILPIFIFLALGANDACQKQIILDPALNMDSSNW